MADREIVKIPLKKIIVSKKREEDPVLFEKLVTSIDQIGMRNAVTLWKNDKGILICSAGRRRCAAAKALGWTEVPAVIEPDTEREAEMWELSENLDRKQYTALEESEAIARLVELAEELFDVKPKRQAPKTKSGGQKTARGKATQETAETIGTTTRTVQRHAKIAGIAKPAKEKLKGTKAAENQSELEALSRVPKNRQTKVATLMVKGLSCAKADAQVRGQQKRGQHDWPDEFDQVMSVHRIRIMQFQSDLMAEKEKFVRWAKAIAKKDPKMAKLAGIGQKLDSKFRALSYIFRDWVIPVGPCPHCKMKGCDECAGDGWVTEGTLRKVEQEDGKPPKKWIL